MTNGMHLSRPTEMYNTKSELSFKLIMYQIWFINCSKCAILMHSTNHRGNGVSRGGASGQSVYMDSLL